MFISLNYYCHFIKVFFFEHACFSATTGIVLVTLAAKNKITFRVKLLEFCNSFLVGHGFLYRINFLCVILLFGKELYGSSFNSIAEVIPNRDSERSVEYLKRG